MRVLMVGVSEETMGGMWSVAKNYLENEEFCKATALRYIPTSTVGTKFRRGLFSLKALIKVFAALVSGGYDIVHIHASERGSIYRKSIVMMLAHMFGCKTVLHMHGAEFQKWYEESPQVIKAYTMFFLNRANKIIILGEYCRSFIETLVSDSRKVCTVYNAVHIEEHKEYNRKATNLLFLGAVGRRKGIEDLLDAMTLIDDQLEKCVKLTIYGPIADFPIEEAIKQKGLQKRVSYLGWLGAEQRGQVFAHTAVNVLPSYYEGLPMTILETMAYGIPNITTAIAGIPEAVDCRNGVLVEPGDVSGLAKSISSLMNQEELRLNMSDQAYQKIKECFGLELHFQSVLSIYEKVCSEK